MPRVHPNRLPQLRIAAPTFLVLRDRFRAAGLELYFQPSREHYEIRGRRRVVLATVDTLREAMAWLSQNGGD